MNVISNLLEFLYNYLFFNISINLFHDSILCSNGNNFLFLNLDLFQFLYQYWYFDNFLDDMLNVSIDFDYLRDYSLHLYEFRAVNSLLDDLLNLINFGDLNDSINDFLYYLLDLFDLLDNSLNRNYFLNESLNFNDSVLDVRHNLLYFFNPLLDNDVIDCSFRLNQLYPLL